MTLRDTFWARVDKSAPDGCWNWTGHITTDGYGKAKDAQRRSLGAHRLAYQELVGPIPDGMEIDHLCRNTRCVNPSHLDAVTPTENWRRSVTNACRRNAAKTHCPQGHPYTPENTLVVTPKDRAPFRRCRRCEQQRDIRRHPRRLP